MKEKPSRDLLLEMYERNRMTAQDIATLRNVSRSVIYRWLDRYGIHRRSISDTALIIANRRTYAEQMRITSASRAIITGKKRSHEDLCKRAEGKQRNAKMSKYESALARVLKKLGWNPIPSFAFDKFNIDLAFPSERIAIEVDGGNWHKTARRKMAQDKIKTDLLKRKRWRIIRISTRRQDWLAIATATITASLPCKEIG